MLLIMGCVYTYAIGAVCGILATMDPASTEYRTKRDLVRTWSDEMRAPPELKTSLLEYMEECRLVIRQRYYHGLLDTLSPMLQQKVAQHQHSGWLTRVAFFQCEDRAERRRFTMTIATQIHQVMFVSREIIASAGEKADCMYTIAKGVVALSSGHVMSVKRYFGEEMLLRCASRPWSANAVTFVTLNVLKKEKLVSVLASGNFPHTAQTVRRWVVRRAFARVVRWLVHLRRARPLVRFPAREARVADARDALREAVERVVLVGHRALLLLHLHADELVIRRDAAVPARRHGTAPARRFAW